MDKALSRSPPIIVTVSDDDPSNGRDNSRVVEANNEARRDDMPANRSHEDVQLAGASVQPNPFAVNPSFLEGLILVEEQRYKDLAFIRSYSAPDKRAVYFITQRMLHHHPPYGLTSRVHITLKGCEYVINTLGYQVESGIIASVEDLDELCRRFSNGYKLDKFCPGIDWNLYEQKYHQVIRFHLKSVRYATFPYQRVDSVRCQLWFKIARNASLAEKAASEVMCSACKRLKADLEHQLKRTRAESPTRKLKRQSASSTARLMHMSPESQQKRKKNMISQRNKGKRKKTVEMPTNPAD